MLIKYRVYIIAIALGFLGMGLFQLGAVLYKDWSFLHMVRIANEQQQYKQVEKK